MQRFSCSTCFTFLSLFLLLGVTGCKAAEVGVDAMLRGAAIEAPAEGMNKIWIEFQDQTSQGGGFEDTMFETIQDAVEERGYEIVRDSADANYALWATLRGFKQVGNAEAYDELLSGLGDVAGPMDNSELDQSPRGGLGEGSGESLMGSGMTTGMKNTFTQTKYFLMVCDVQIGLSQEEEGASDSSNSASAIRDDFSLANQQRLAVLAKGSNMSLSKARQLLVPRLVDAVRGQMPRYRW